MVNKSVLLLAFDVNVGTIVCCTQETQYVLPNDEDDGMKSDIWLVSNEIL